MNPLATTFFELFADNLPHRPDKVFLIDPDRAATTSLRGDVTRLAPFERFLELAHALGFRSDVEDELAKGAQLCRDGSRVTGEDGGDVRVVDFPDDASTVRRARSDDSGNGAESR